MVAPVEKTDSMYLVDKEYSSSNTKDLTEMKELVGTGRDDRTGRNNRTGRNWQR